MNRPMRVICDVVAMLIEKEFGFEYTPKQIRIIVKTLGMRYAKPYTYDYRRPDDAEDLLKNSTLP